MSTLDGIKARLEAAAPTPDVEWAALTDPGDRTTAPAWIVDADAFEIRLPATYEAGKVAAFIAHSPTDMGKLLSAVESILALHRPVAIYELDDEGHVQEDKHVRDICGTCSDSSVTENLDDGNYDLAGEYGEVQHPCPTVAALTAALEGKP